MAGVLGRAFIQVFADLSKFSPNLRKEIKKALDEQTKGMEFSELDKAAERAGEKAADEVAKGVDKKIDKNLKKSGERGGLSLGKGLSTAFGVMTTAFLPTIIALGVEMVAALAPVVTMLAGTIPVAITSLVATLAVLKMATSGVGEALKTAFDPAKAAQFQEAMKKLAPAARGFVMEIKNLHGPFKQLQTDVQQTFFVQLQGVLTHVSRTLLPTLHTGLVTLAGDMGRAGRSLAGGLAGSRGNLSSIFTTMHVALIPLIPLIGQFVQAFTTIGAVAGPTVVALSTGMAGLLSHFVAFVNASAASGGMARFFSDALVVLKQFGSLLGNVVGLVGDIMQALQATGGQGIGALSRIIGLLREFFGSAQGQKALVGLFNLLNVALESLFQIITPLLPAIGTITSQLSGVLAGALRVITPLLVQIAKVLGENPGLLYAAAAAWGAYKLAMIPAIAQMLAFDAAADANPIGLIVIAIALLVLAIYELVTHWKEVTHWIGVAWHAVGDFFSNIWGWIKGVGKDIANWFTVTVPNFFASLPGKIWAALSALPALLGRLFLDALNFVGQVIGTQIGLILAFFIKLPQWIWAALAGLGDLLVRLVKMAFELWKAEIDLGIRAVVWFFTVLPGKIWNAITSIPGLIRTAFRNAWNWAKEEVRQGADAVVDFVRALPGRIRGFMSNVGHDILGGLKAGINAVISGFNSGIDRVAGMVHIGLPHIPLLATGGLVTSPTLAVVGEAGPEAVVPMSNPDRAADVARRTGLLDILGARMGGSGDTIVRVYLGTREITDILDVRVQHALDAQARELAYGTR